MTCPHCGFQFTQVATNEPVTELPSIAPGVCTECASLFILDGKITRTLKTGELEALQQAPIWPWLSNLMVQIGRAVRAKQHQQLGQFVSSKKPILN